MIVKILDVTIKDCDVEVVTPFQSTVYFPWDSIEFHARDRLSALGIPIYYSPLRQMSCIDIATSKIEIIEADKKLLCECGKDKHGFMFHMFYCDKFEE